jgi:hypothetical protein
MTDANLKKPKGKAATPKKMAYAGKKPTGDFHYEITNITLPDLGQIHEFQSAHNMSEDQISALIILLEHIHLDLEGFNIGQIDGDEREAMIGAIYDFAQQIHKLKSSIDKNINLLGAVLPLNVMQNIGEALDLSFSYEILNNKNSYLRLNQDLERHQSEMDKIDAEFIARLTHPRRKTAGLEQGHILLQSLIDRIHDGVEFWINENKKNKGGRPRKYVREYLLYGLVSHAKVITGRKPPHKKEGWFVEFVQDVAELCGLSRNGIYATLPKIIKDVEDKKKQR